MFFLTDKRAGKATGTIQQLIQVVKSVFFRNSQRFCKKVVKSAAD